MKAAFEQLFQVLGQIIKIDSEIVSITEKNFSYKTFKKGQILLSPSEISSKLYFINKGLIRLYSISDDKEIIKQFFFENAFSSDYASFITKSPSNSFLEVMEDLECLVIHHDTLTQMYDDFPILLKIGKIMAENAFVHHYHRNESMIKDDALTRYSKLLKERPKVLQRVPLYMISSYLGLTPEGLSRIRKKDNIGSILINIDQFKHKRQSSFLQKKIMKNILSIFKNSISRLFALLIIVLVSTMQLNAQQLQTLRGKIVDEISRTSLPGANIIVVGSNPIIGTSTDINGEYKLTVPIGRTSIKVSSLGYEEKTLNDIILISGKETVLTISLSEKVTQINEVTVTYDRTKDQKVTNNEMVTISGRSFNIEDTKRYAGSFGDPSRMAANFAGVNAGNDSRNDIVVRGNSPQGTLWQLEGLNIPNPNHFGGAFSTGGPVSMLNNNVLDKSDFLTGAFPAQYGNALSAVFDLKLRTGNNEKREYVAQVGINGFELGAEGPFKNKGGASFLINYRYSTLGLLQSIGVDPGTGDATPLYQDLTFNLSFPKFLKGKLSVYGIAGISSIDLLGKDVDTTATNFYGQLDQNLYPRYSSGIFGTTYERTLNKNTFLKVSFGGNIAKNDYAIDSIDLVTESYNIYRIRQGNFNNQSYTTHIQLSNKINAKNNIVSGTNINLIIADYFNKDVIPGFGDYVYVDTKGTGVLGNLYSQWKHRLSERMSFNIGFNFQYFNTNDEVSAALEPRFGWKYLVGKNSSIRAGYGIHHQNQTMYTYNVQTYVGDQIFYTNRELGFTKAQHFILGYEQTISNTIQFKVETYYQSISNAPVTINPSSYSGLNQGADFAPSDQDSLVSKGTGSNIGLELTLEKSFSNNYYFLVTGSLYDSKYKGSDNVERNTAFNTNYAANFLVGKDFKLGKKNKTLSLNFRATSTGGRYLTPLNLEASALKGDAVKDEFNAFSLRQNPYFRLDFKIGYKKEYKASTLEIAIDFQNLTDNKNVFDQGYNRKTNTISTEYQQGLNIIPSVKFNF